MRELIFNVTSRVLSIVFFSAACVSCDKYADMALPFSDYIVEGTVTDESGEPIPGIRVAFGGMEENRFAAVSSAFTDAHGEYEMRMCDQLFSQNGMLLEFTDIDDMENGGRFGTCIVNTVFERISDGDNQSYIGGFKAVNIVVLKRLL